MALLHQHLRTVEMMKKVFYEKKAYRKKYMDFLEHVVIDIYKGYEHNKLKKISGSEIDALVKGAKITYKE